MTDITVIILVGREERHIGRCLERLAPLEPRQVVVVESQKGDRTHEIAIETAARLQWRVESAELSVERRDPQLLTSHSSLLTSHSSLLTFFHSWPGNQAAQFNWAIDALCASEKCEVSSEKCEVRSEKCSEWILRLDADEYLEPETIERMREKLGVGVGVGVGLSNVSNLKPQTSNLKLPLGFTLELKRRFCGGEIRHGTNGIRLLRLWKRGAGRSEERAMDEHIVIDGESDLDVLRASGKVVDFPGAFYDDNLNDMDWWREKHRGYAKREAADALAFYRGELTFKPMKAKYYRMPRYFRAFVYFFIRYVLKGGFLDGRAGWMWNFWQGLWYRLLVDREIGRGS